MELNDCKWAICLRFLELLRIVPLGIKDDKLENLLFSSMGFRLNPNLSTIFRLAMIITRV
jgi:hypothetical protein